MPRTYSSDFKNRAVRLVQDRMRDDESAVETAVISDTALKLGIGKETLRKGVRQTEIDAGARPGVSSEESAELRRLRRENAELRRTNEIVKLASAFFAKEPGRPGKK